MREWSNAYNHIEVILRMPDNTCWHFEIVLQTDRQTDEQTTLTLELQYIHWSLTSYFGHFQFTLSEGSPRTRPIVNTGLVRWFQTYSYNMVQISNSLLVWFTKVYLFHQVQPTNPYSDWLSFSMIVSAL